MNGAAQKRFFQCGHDGRGAGAEAPERPAMIRLKRSLPALWKSLCLKITKRKLVRNVGVLTVANMAGAALSFLQGILVARWLGPELYGVAALVMSYPSLLHAFLDTRSAEASVKYLSEFAANGERERILAMCKLGYVVDLATAGLMFLTVFLTGQWAADRIAHRPEASGLLIVYAAAFLPRALVGTSYAVLVTLGRFPLIALLDILTTIVRVSLVLGAVLSGWKVAGIVWGNALAMSLGGFAYILTAAILTSRAWAAFPWQGNWRALTGRHRQILSFLAYNNLNAMLGMIPKQLDTILLGYFRTPVEVGYYKLARNLSGAVGYLVNPLQSVVYPDFTRLWGREDRDALRRRVQRLAIYVGAPLGVAVLGGTLLIPWGIPLLVGRDYYPTVVITQLLFIGAAVWGTFFWLRPLYFAMGLVRRWAVGMGVYSALFLLLSMLSVPSWGYMGLTCSLVTATVLFHVGMSLVIYATDRQGRKSF
jgi:O-antigen/teichoic acid export membrane protein